MLDSIRISYLDNKRQSLFEKKRWDELALICRDLVKLAPDNFHYVHDLVVSLGESRKFDEAAQWCERVLRLAPKTALDNIYSIEGTRYLRYLIVASEVYIHKQDWEAARRLLTPLKQLGTAFHRKHLLLSEIAEMRGDLALAAAELEEMRELYASHDVHQWEHVILARARALMLKAREKRDANAFVTVTRILVHSRDRTGELDSYIEARASTSELQVEYQCLRAQRAILRGDSREREDSVTALKGEWNELADRLAASPLPPSKADGNGPADGPFGPRHGAAAARSISLPPRKRLAYPDWIYYPSSVKPPPWARELVSLIADARPQIDSSTGKNLERERVLSSLRRGLIGLGYEVSTAHQTLPLPMRYGDCGAETLSFNADAFNEEAGIALKMDDGLVPDSAYRALLQACLAINVKHVALGVLRDSHLAPDCRGTYSDLRDMLDAVAAGGRLKLPVEGLLLFGY